MRNHYRQKTDVMIKIDGAIKGISIKEGTRNSVHATKISNFIKFLKDSNIDDDIIEKYLRYHYADGTTNGTGSNRIGATEYKKIYQKEIDEINNALNNLDIVKKAIETFVILGNNSKYRIDALVYGNYNDFFFLLPHEIEEILLNNENYCTAPHFGKLVLQPMARCLNKNSRYEDYRRIVQVRWYNILDDIIFYKNKKAMSKVEA